MKEMSKTMKFRVKYSWPTERIDFVNHTQISELNIAFDMSPFLELPPTNSRLMVGRVIAGFVAELTDKMPIRRRLDHPFDKQLWMAILIMFFFIAAFCLLSRSFDVIGILLKIIGVLVGVGTGNFPSGLSWTIINWAFQLPALVIQQAYLAVLTDNLTIPIKVPRLAKPFDLQKMNYTILCDDIIIKFGQSQQNVTLRNWYSRCIPSNLTNDYNRVFPSIIQSGRLNKTSVFLNSDFILFNNLKHIYIINNTELSQYIRGHRGVLFISEMENIWRRFEDGGISNFWYKRNIDEALNGKNDHSDDVNDNLMGSIELLLYGCLVGFVVLIIEIFINKVGWKSVYQKLVCRCPYRSVCNRVKNAKNKTPKGKKAWFGLFSR